MLLDTGNILCPLIWTDEVQCQNNNKIDTLWYQYLCYDGCGYCLFYQMHILILMQRIKQRYGWLNHSQGPILQYTYMVYKK